MTKSNLLVSDAEKLAVNVLATRLRASWMRVQQSETCTRRMTEGKGRSIGDRPHHRRLLPVHDPSILRLSSVWHRESLARVASTTHQETVDAFKTSRDLLWCLYCPQQHTNPSCSHCSSVQLCRTIPWKSRQPSIATASGLLNWQVGPRYLQPFYTPLAPYRSRF